MTQAYNLAILANAVNTSGQLNVGTNATGTLPLANGGTGTTNTVNTVVAGSGISVSTSGTQVTVTNTSSATGTVTSVATGNGLQGGTITTTGTLSVACPTFNTVGSYSFGRFNNAIAVTGGTNYAAGNGNSQLQATSLADEGSGFGPLISNTISGTWKWMGSTRNETLQYVSVICRVS